MHQVWKMGTRKSGPPVPIDFRSTEQEIYPKADWGKSHDVGGTGRERTLRGGRKGRQSPCRRQRLCCTFSQPGSPWSGGDPISSPVGFLTPEDLHRRWRAGRDEGPWCGRRRCAGAHPLLPGGAAGCRCESAPVPACDIMSINSAPGGGDARNCGIRGLHSPEPDPQ